MGHSEANGCGRFPRRETDVKTLVDMVRNKLKGDGITDDKTMIMERVIALVADLPHQSKLREELTNTFLNELWHSLEHPPLLYVGNEYSYRTADGSNNVSYISHLVAEPPESTLPLM